MTEYGIWNLESQTSLGAVLEGKTKTAGTSTHSVMSSILEMINLTDFCQAWLSVEVRRNAAECMKKSQESDSLLLALHRARRANESFISSKYIVAFVATVGVLLTVCRLECSPYGKAWKVW